MACRLTLQFSFSLFAVTCRSCSAYICGVGLRANNSAADLACTAQTCASVCCQAAECEMLPQTGYVTCPPTALGASCVVTCAAGYSGKPTSYKCQIVGELTTFVANGAVNTCNLLRYARCPPDRTL